jgi:RNA polymerase sigma-70 factor (ECF subfamily)
VKSDETLIEEALGGSEDAYSLLVAKYWQRIFRFLRRRVNDNALAEDITQQTFIAAFKYLKTFRGDSSLYTWLCTIAINNASKTPSNSLKTEHELHTVENPETILQVKQTVAEVMEVWSTLPRKQQRALYLRIHDNMRYYDIGIALRCSEQYAKKLVYLAKRTIRKEVNGKQR